MTLSKNLLKDYREQIGYSQERLAQDLGVTRQTIISIEKNKYVPSLLLALRLAKKFKCKVEDIFDGDDQVDRKG